MSFPQVNGPGGPAGMNFSGAASATGEGGLPGGDIPLFPFFEPSFDLPLIGALVAAFLTVIHTYLVFKTKAKYFNLAPQAALLLAGGLTLKVVMAALLNTGANLKTLFTASLTLLQIPIPLTAISIIFTYTRLMWWITPPGHRNIGTLWAPPMYHSLTIAGAQFVADIMGILGSGMIIKTPIPRLVSASSVLEMLVWLFLAILVFRFTLISRQWPMERSVRKGSQELGLALTLQAVLLASRGIYQVLQKDALLALQTTGRPISIVTTEEWPDYVFNILPTILILALQAVWHPGLYLPKRLMGFSLKRKQLLKDEATKGGGSPASNGWIISAPSPVTSEKMNGLEAKYMEILEAERKQYEPKYIGYAS